tara:strand:- start:398 stop:598 length:201 start_codon:yes stop_codon:yes gene_type:complete
MDNKIIIKTNKAGVYESAHYLKESTLRDLLPDINQDIISEEDIISLKGEIKIETQNNFYFIKKIGL